MAPNQDERIRRVFEAVGVKGELSRTARRMLRQTASYDAARTEGRATAWLDEEADSFAESAYMILMDRIEEAGGQT